MDRRGDRRAGCPVFEWQGSAGALPATMSVVPMATDVAGLAVRRLADAGYR